MAFDREYTEGCSKYGVSGTALIIGAMAGAWTNFYSTFGSGSWAVANSLQGAGYSITSTSGSGGSGSGYTSISKTLLGNFNQVCGSVMIKTPLTTSNVGVVYGDGTADQVSICIEPSTGFVTVRRGGNSATIIATTVQSVAANSVHVYAWKLTISNTIGIIKIYIDGVVTSIDLTGQNTRGGSSNNYLNTRRIFQGISGGDPAKITWQHFNEQLSTSANSDLPYLDNPLVNTDWPTSDSSVQFTPASSVLGQDYSITAGTNAPGANQLALRKFTPVQNCTINSVNIFPSATSAGAKLKGVIYSDSAGSPNALLSSGTEVTGLTAATVATLPLVTPQALTSGTPYWIGYITDTSVALYEVDSTTTGAKAANTYASGAPGTAPGMTTGQASWIVFGLCTSNAVNWPAVSNTFGNPPLGDYSYNSDSTVGHTDLFGFPALPGGATTVHTVGLWGWCERSDAGARTVDLIVHSVSTTGTGSDPGQAPGATTYGWLSSYNKTDPNGSIAWTPANVNASTAGYDVAA